MKAANILYPIWDLYSTDNSHVAKFTIISQSSNKTYVWNNCSNSFLANAAAITSNKGGREDRGVEGMNGWVVIHDHKWFHIPQCLDATHHTTVNAKGFHTGADIVEEPKFSHTAGNFLTLTSHSSSIIYAEPPILANSHSAESAL